MPLFSILLFAGIVFGFLGACAAFLITWNEYAKHRWRGRRLFMEAFRAGLFAFAFFLALSVALALVFAKVGV